MSRLDLASILFAFVVGLVATNLAAYAAGHAEGRNVHDCDHERTAEFWRSMYLKADKDSRFVNCLELDRDYFICEKSAHAQR